MKSKLDALVPRAAPLGGYLRAALSTEGRRAMMSWKPFSASAFRLVGRVRKMCGDFDTVIDGGANVGQFARAAIEIFPGASILSFEPNPEAFTVLERNLASSPRFVGFNVALGELPGEQQFWINSYSHASSMLRLLPGAHEKYPSLGREREIRVRVDRLDDLVEGRVRGRSLLKLDLQGYELRALAGAHATLARTDVAVIEIGTGSTYEREPVFHDVHERMRQAGFELAGIADVLEDAEGLIGQLDAVYRRSRSPG